MSGIPKVCKSDWNNRLFLGLLYSLGIVHWIVFFFLVFSQGAKPLTALSPTEWFSFRDSYGNDWYQDMSYVGIIQDAIRSHTLPFHVTNFGNFFIGSDRFLGSPVWTMSPQIILLYWLRPFTFTFINLLFMYSIGFYGCILLRKHYNLGWISFCVLFLLFNFNGYFVEKITAYGAAQMGYFFLPYMALVMFNVTEVEPSDHRTQLRWGIWLGAILAAILYQGSTHLYVECITFVLFWGLANYRLWRPPLAACLVSFSLALVRLLPAAVAYGPGGSPHQLIHGGYPSPEWLIQGLVGIRTQLDPPQFAWWEYSLYVSIVGLFFLVYFGMLVPFMRLEWRRFRQWPTMAVPCIVLCLASIRQWKQYIIPNFIPLLNSESLTARYMIIPLVITTIIAVINLQGFTTKYWDQKRVRHLLIIGVTTMAAFLFHHSRLWRMPKVHRELRDYITNNEAAREAYSYIFHTKLHISNNPEDVYYIASFWVGFLVSCFTMVLMAWWLRNDWSKHPPHSPK